MEAKIFNDAHRTQEFPNFKLSRISALLTVIFSTVGAIFYFRENCERRYYSPQIFSCASDNLVMNCQLIGPLKIASLKSDARDTRPFVHLDTRELKLRVASSASATPVVSHRRTRSTTLILFVVTSTPLRRGLVTITLRAHGYYFHYAVIGSEGGGKKIMNEHLGGRESDDSFSTPFPSVFTGVFIYTQRLRLLHARCSRGKTRARQRRAYTSPRSLNLAAAVKSADRQLPKAS